jgi:hypothetical protein
MLLTGRMLLQSLLTLTVYRYNSISQGEQREILREVHVRVDYKGMLGMSEVRDGAWILRMHQKMEKLSL